MLTKEQKELLKEQEDLLKDVLTPLINNYILKTECMPVITISKESLQTKCGAIESFPKIHISSVILKP